MTRHLERELEVQVHKGRGTLWRCTYRFFVEFPLYKFDSRVGREFGREVRQKE